jgi:hypothetical protein
MLALVAGHCAAETKDAASTPPLRTNKQQAAARVWLSTNTMTAGRSRGETPMRRALLVGINTYEPSYEEMKQREASTKSKKKKGRGSFANLDGCVNDVEELRGLLIARFGFKAEDVLVLTNQAATREAILAGINTQLVQPSRPGDVALFFYAGHGSQVVNSKAKDEPDGKDETLVPADSWTGVPDIRDKELRGPLNAILDKGAMLTVIFDSCHSGSAARGNSVPVKTRHAEPILEDIADATDYGPSPEERGALVLAAAQDDQYAEEQTHGDVPHGAFTAALLRVLRLTVITRTASDIFLSISSALQADGHAQVPVLAGNDTRRKLGLFGEDSGLSGNVSVAVLSVSGAGEVTLQGGRAAGLNAGCQLRQVPTDSNAPVATLKVTRVDGLMQSKAEVIEGGVTNVHAGDVFEVSQWVIAPEAMLRVWLPSASLSTNQLDAALKLADELRKSTALDWVNDPTAVTPTHFLSWDGSRWNMQGPDGLTGWFNENATAAQVLKALSGGNSRPKLFMSLPAPAELKAELGLGRDSENDAVEIVSKPEDAHYLLVGAMRDGVARYAWMLPNTSGEQSAILPLPVRTYWFPTNGQVDTSAKAVASQLQDSALRIGKVKSWLTLEAPADDGRFLYRLAFKNEKIGELVTGGGLALQTSTETGEQQLHPILPVMKGGEKYAVLLHADAEAIKGGMEERYIYVFTLDSAGRSQLLWPRGGQGNSQRFPPSISGAGSYPQDIPLNAKFSVGPPYGIDTYVLLTSLEAIPDATVLEFDGVRSGTRGGNDANPLQRLLKSVGSSTRGAVVEAPANWSIQRISVKSVER